MLEGHQFYGYLPGGASGGILPASKGDIPLDFDTLQAARRVHRLGCRLSSFRTRQSLESRREPDEVLPRRVLRPVHALPVGTAKALTLMKQGKWDQPLLGELSQAMMDASICGLGQAAPNPALTVMKYFPQEI
jgi:formate dehydrogenase